MPLCSMKTLLDHARRNHYAVGYFESWSMDSMLAVVDAAENTGSPVIIGFGGQFVSKLRDPAESVRHWGALGLSIAKASKVPTALLLNEALTVDLLVQGLCVGFNAVMYENPDVGSMENERIQAFISDVAHQLGAVTEAELGELPSADIATGALSQGRNTSPDEAVAFVERTGVDALAISIGNVHLLEGQKSHMDFALLETPLARVPVPLVLHGGTGIDASELQKAISMGVAKINVGTALKRIYLNSLRNYIETHDIDRIDPHNIIGRGEDTDMLERAREAVRRETEAFMHLFGCCGQAGEVG